MKKTILFLIAITLFGASVIAQNVCIDTPELINKPFTIKLYL